VNRKKPLKKQGVRMWIGFNKLGYGPMTVFCGHGNDGSLY